MTLYLLDSDCVIDYSTNISSTVSFVDALYAAGETLCTCAVVLTEVCSGFSERERLRHQPLLESLTFLPTSASAGQQAGEWRYAYARRGIQLSTTDMLIVATARQHGARIVTGNVKDYPMPESDVEPLPRVRRNGSG